MSFYNWLGTLAREGTYYCTYLARMQIRVLTRTGILPTYSYVSMYSTVKHSTVSDFRGLYLVGKSMLSILWSHLENVIQKD